MVFIVVVSRVVGDLILDARPRGAGVAAAERHAINQVAAIDVALYTATGKRKICVSNLLASNRCGRNIISAKAALGRAICCYRVTFKVNERMKE